MSNYSASSFDETSQNTSWYKALNLIPSQSTVLDVGCSSGNFGSELIKRQQCAVDGIEIDCADASAARGKLRYVWELNIETDDLGDLKGPYDVIYFGDVIEHLVSPIETLKRIKPFLAKNGQVVFSIPNMAHVGVRLELLGGQFQYAETGLLDKTHLHFYDQPEISRVFQEAGYAIDQLDYVKKDYPRKVLDEELHKLGLAANPSFYDRMRQVDAAAFQFVGSAKLSPQAGTPPARPAFSPVDHFQRLADELETSIAKLKHANQELRSNYANLESDKNALVAKIAELKSHPIRSAFKYSVRIIKKRLKRH
jgi:2-polyprenyl-3-methyl-5-hydroxy-6-metoxy-1,4-benzoquinol methylase